MSEKVGFVTDLGQIMRGVDEFPAGAKSDRGITGTTIAGQKFIRITRGIHKAEEVGVFANGQDMASRLQAVVDDVKGLKAIELHKDGGGDFLVNGDVTLPSGFLLQITPGCRLTGTGSITYGYVNADENSSIFSSTFKANIQGSVTGRTSAKWWGAVGDGNIIAGVISGTDDTTNIQRAINQAVYFNYGSSGHLHFPSGKYRVTKTLHVGYGFQEQGFHSMKITGNRAGFGIPGDSMMIVDHFDGSGFNVQGARGVYVDGLTMQGRLISKETPSPYDGDLSNPTNWHTNVPVVWDHRYKPYCAFSTDMYGGTKPVGSNELSPATDITFPTEVVAVTGVSYQYGKRFSSFVHFSNCYTAGFVAGIVVNPSPTGTQNDYITAEDCYFTNNIYGVSSGAPNTRVFTLTRCNFIAMYLPLITTKHGAQQGGIGVCTGCEFSYVYKWIDTNLAFSGAGLFEGCSGEGIGMLGTFGDPGFEGISGITFMNCTIYCNHIYGIPTGHTTWPSYYETFITGPYTKFVNCKIASYSVLVVNGSVNLEGCSLWDNMLPSEIAPAPTIPVWWTEFMRNTTGGIIVVNGRKTGRDNKLYIQNQAGFDAVGREIVEVVLDDVTDWSSGQLSHRYASDITRYIADFTETMFRQANSQQPIRYSLAAVDEVNPQSFTLVGKTVTFSLANSQNTAIINIGDTAVFKDANGKYFAGVVINKVSLAITVRIMNNFYRNADADFTGWLVTPMFTNYAGSPNTGVVYFQSCRRWFTPRPVYGDLVAASGIISNVRDGNGSPAAALFRVDDAIAGGPSVSAVSNEINHKLKMWPAPVRITEIPNSTTLYVSGQPTVSGKRIQLFNVI